MPFSLERSTFCDWTDAVRKIIVFFTLSNAASHFEAKNHCLRLKLLLNSGKKYFTVIKKTFKALFDFRV